jgi:hypothetical protein
MGILRTASFGALFGASFMIAATFLGALAMLGFVEAFVSPAFFNAATPGAALGVVALLLSFGLAVNAMVSASGAGLWLLVRAPLRRQGRT